MCYRSPRKAFEGEGRLWVLSIPSRPVHPVRRLSQQRLHKGEACAGAAHSAAGAPDSGLGDTVVPKG